MATGCKGCHQTVAIRLKYTETFVFKLVIGAALLASGLLAAQAARSADTPAVGGWRSLFDGKSLAGWKESDFLGAGKVSVENGVITIGSGALTGINWATSSPPFPSTNYEVRIEAARLKGSDFFAGITFPVRDSFCTWINGGWGGLVVGLSSLDGRDASENETMREYKFAEGRWYALRLRVTDERIQAWIDDEKIIDVALEGREIGLRPGDIYLSAPFGIASYSTVGALRKIEYRMLPAR